MNNSEVTNQSNETKSGFASKVKQQLNKVSQKVKESWKLTTSRASNEENSGVKLISGGKKMPGRPPKVKRSRNPESKTKSAFTKDRPPSTTVETSSKPSSWVEPMAEAVVTTTSEIAKRNKKRGKGFGKK